MTVGPTPGGERREEAPVRPDTSRMRIATQLYGNSGAPPFIARSGRVRDGFLSCYPKDGARHPRYCDIRQCASTGIFSPSFKSPWTKIGRSDDIVLCLA